MDGSSTTAHKRIIQHEMEDKSRQIFKSVVPAHWVVRNYDYPDYGIDLAIEVFDKVDGGTSITSGEHLFVQLKSENVSRRTKIRIGEGSEIEAIKYTIETKALHTATKMGTAMPLLLVLVCFDSGQVFYLCLNDYISACNARISKTQIDKTVYIPTSNELTGDEGYKRFRLYSTRAKLFSLFSLLEFQRTELLYMLDASDDEKITPEQRVKVMQFINELIDRDVWSIDHPWKGVYVMRNDYIQPLKKYFDTGLIEGAPQLLSAAFKFGGEHLLLKTAWEQMCVLHGIYHEIIRQRELPSEIEGLFSENG